MKATNVTQYLLEVIRTNTGAFKLYRKAGFQVTREFDYYVSLKSEVALYPLEIKEEYQIKRTHDPDWNTYQTFWDILPSWQNSIASINRKIGRFNFLEIQIINVDASYQPFKQLAQHLNLSRGFGQFEMMLEL
ncbi:hypothetical protein ACFLS7_01570 [Bacteroidota bacterium]